MDRFPERLGNAFCVDAPTLFTTMYAILKPLIPEVGTSPSVIVTGNIRFPSPPNQDTKAKIHFVKSSGTAGRYGRMDPVVARFFDDDDLEEDYGGTRPRLVGVG